MMSDVIIKGMEMPENCKECRLHADGWCYAVEDQPFATLGICRPDWCPLCTAPEWISVEDRLPEAEDMVLVATVRGGVYYGFLNHSGKFYTANNTLYDSWCWEPDATHWMPLPEPPEGGDGDG